MIKALGAKLYAAWSHLKNEKWIKTPLETQEKVLVELLKQGAQTRFGKDHNFEKIRDLKTYQKEVPVRDYEGFKPYIDAILEGEKDVLWKGRPLYYAKSSGTTSGAKYIPITKASMPQHIRAAREALLNYIHHSGNTSVVKGKHIFVQGSPVLEDYKGSKANPGFPERTIGKPSNVVATEEGVPGIPVSIPDIKPPDKPPTNTPIIVAKP